MMSKFSLITLTAVLALASLVTTSTAAFTGTGTYVDATAANTTNNAGGQWYTAASVNDDLWRRRTDYGEGTTMFEGDREEDHIAFLKTTIGGLTAGSNYTIRVVFGGHTTLDWSIRAGLGNWGPGLTTYNDANSTDTGTDYGTDIPQREAVLGTVTANGSGEIDVFILNAPIIFQRTWYDGVTYELTSDAVTLDDVNYVDATAANTTNNAGGQWYTAASGNDDLWRRRTDQGGEGTTTFEGDAVEDNIAFLKTTIGGLTAGSNYKIGVVFGGHTTLDWSIRAGLGNWGPGLTTYNDANSTDTGTDYVANAPQREAELGTVTANGSGEIDVFILNAPLTGQRTWYDGVTYELTADAVMLPGPINYVDATTANTTNNAGGAWWASPVSSTDDRWSDRPPDGRSGTIWESSGGDAGTEEDSPLLKTTITGLTPNMKYEISVVYSATSEWKIQAGLGAAVLTMYDIANGTATGASYGQPEYAAVLGEAIANGSGEIAVYIDDYTGSGGDTRTRYDGVVYQFSAYPAGTLIIIK